MLLANLAIGADWPQWRGQNRNGTSNETGWTSEWTGEPKIAWNATVGLGFSSMVVSGGGLATVGHADSQDTVFCFDAVSGKPVWKHSYPAELGDKYYEGGTTGTPICRDNRLIVRNSETPPTRTASTWQKSIAPACKKFLKITLFGICSPVATLNGAMARAMA